MKMAAAGSRTGPGGPGPNGGDLHSCPGNSAPGCGQQDSGAPMSSQNGGPSAHPQQHFSTRPLFYVPTPPPPPPFLPFQWPMPFSYNPFGGFPGYGMVLPPFAPPPYLDPPAYILPHPHLQPVDYRRMLPPQVPVPAVPYQNPNLGHRIRLPSAAPARETVNSAVQTEAPRGHAGRYANGSPPIRSDSGHATASDSPSSSSSSSHKQASEENCCITNRRSRDLQPLNTGKSGADRPGGDVLAPRAVDVDVPSCIRVTVERQKRCKANVDQENIPPYRSGRHKVWSVGSPDSIVPVCTSSQQEDEVIRERRVSFPDILMNWGTPQATAQKTPDENYHQNENKTQEQEKSVGKSPKTTNCPAVLENSDIEDNSGSVLCPQELRNGVVDPGASGRRPFLDKDLLDSLNVSNEPEGDERDPIAETISFHMLLNNMKGKMNESAWSVESLPPFIPPKELRKLFDSDVIIETSEEVDKEAIKRDKSGGEKTALQRTSSCDSVPASDSWLDMTSASRPVAVPRRPEGGPDKRPPTSPSPPTRDVAPPAREAQPERSSEPEALVSPNQDVTPPQVEQGERAPAGGVGGVTEADTDLGGTEETSERIEAASPPRGRLVDCGVQCTSLLPCPYDEPRRHNFKNSDLKDNGDKDRFYTNGQKNKRNALRKYRGNARNHWQ